jgi:hypothetical protein
MPEFQIEVVDVVKAFSASQHEILFRPPDSDFKNKKIYQVSRNLLEGEVFVELNIKCNSNDPNVDDCFDRNFIHSRINYVEICVNAKINAYASFLPCFKSIQKHGTTSVIFRNGVASIKERLWIPQEFIDLLLPPKNVPILNFQLKINFKDLMFSSVPPLSNAEIIDSYLVCQ